MKIEIKNYQGYTKSLAKEFALGTTVESNCGNILLIIEKHEFTGQCFCNLETGVFYRNDQIFEVRPRNLKIIDDD